jgi:hypothetical protein
VRSHNIKSKTTRGFLNSFYSSCTNCSFPSLSNFIQVHLACAILLSPLLSYHTHSQLSTASCRYCDPSEKGKRNIPSHAQKMNKRAIPSHLPNSKFKRKVASEYEPNSYCLPLKLPVLPKTLHFLPPPVFCALPSSISPAPTLPLLSPFRVRLT